MARVEFFARTEVGCVRERNEDSFAVMHLATGDGRLSQDARIREIDSGGLLLAVCDGMGGAAAGDVASQMAAESLRRSLRGHSPFRDGGAAQEALLDSVRAANRSILNYAQAHPEKHGMGTTLTAALVMGSELHVVHIGDSRAYLRRGRALTQVTTDHSVVGQMLASGQLTPEQARHYEHRNVLLQALGVQPVIQPETVVVPLRAGDVLLLCSDGLTGPLTDANVLDLMLRFEDPVRGCRALTEAACAAGGSDNVTVAIARFLGEDLPFTQGREPVRVRRAAHAVQ